MGDKLHCRKGNSPDFFVKVPKISLSVKGSENVKTAKRFA